MPRQMHISIPKDETQKLIRLTISLPPDQYNDLAFISERMGISRSAVLTQMLGEGLAHARRLVACVPNSPDDYTVSRYRGDSKEIIRGRLQTLMADLDQE